MSSIKMGEKNFAVIGVAGYVAPRHLRAIKDTNNRIVGCMDPSDSVGIIDSYSDNADFYTEFERFSKYAEKLKGTEKQIDYVTICSPNYLHDAHIQFAFRIGATAICEKPIVLESKDIELLRGLEEQHGQKVYTILQLRNHPSIIKLKDKYKNNTEKQNIEVKYVTPRGKWYKYSWKGDIEKSGGPATNIGVHVFDMLSWIFGDPKEVTVNEKTESKVSGTLELEQAHVNWDLSLNKSDLPMGVKQSYRLITINGKELEYSDGFTDLHTLAYQQILKNEGFGLDDVVNAIKITEEIRKLDPEKQNTYRW